MIKRKFRLTTVFLVLLAYFLPTVSAFADTTNQYNYNYSNRGINMAPAGFELTRIIDRDFIPGIGLSSVEDICVSGGKIYIVDRVQARVNVLDAETYEFLTSIKMIRDKDNKIVVDEETNAQLMLAGPEGVFVSENTEELYIADTSEDRIIVLSSVDYTLERIIERPENMVGTTNFRPSKIAVDRSGRIYCVVLGSFEGIIELNPNGSFSRYYGVNSPQTNLIDQFWKSIASDNQRARMAKTFAPSFSNIDVDREGFVYAVTNDTASQNMYFRFNARGENVAREMGYTPVSGDLTRFFINTSTASQFVDISVTDYGVYAILDKTLGRVFVYNFDGFLMTIFSKLGNMKGDLRDPSAISWNGDDLIVCDRDLAVAYVYSPTDFGSAALEAERRYSNGEWDAANEYFQRAVKLNANYYVGYSGIGRNYLMKDEYERAMYYFELASNNDNYSRAFNGYRGLFIRDYFIFFAIGIVAIIFIIIYTEVRYVRKQKA